MPESAQCSVTDIRWDNTERKERDLFEYRKLGRKSTREALEMHIFKTPFSSFIYHHSYWIFHL